MAEMKGSFRFTVNTAKLFEESALMLMTLSKGGGAGVGLINGFMVILQYLKEISEIAIERNDAETLLRLYALGLIGNPVKTLKKAGVWNDELNEYAITIGAVPNEWE